MLQLEGRLAALQAEQASAADLAASCWDQVSPSLQLFIYILLY